MILYCFAKTIGELKNMTKKLSNIVLKKVELDTNKTKTKTISAILYRVDKVIQREILESVNACMSQLVQTNPLLKLELRRCIPQGWSASGRQENI